MSALSEQLGAADPDQIRTFLSTTPASTLADLFEATSDEELQELLDTPGTRKEVVAMLMRRMPELTEPKLLRALDATIRFELTHRGKVTEDHVLTFHRGAVTEVEQYDDPNVTIRTTVVHIIRLVTAQENAALLAIAGDLTFDGDAILALDLAAAFAGRVGKVVAVAELEPSDVAAAVKRASGASLRAFMSTSARGLVLTEVFRRFPDFIDDSKSASLGSTIVFRLGGADEPERYVVRFVDGVCTTAEGDTEERDATIVMDGADFLRLATGNLNMMKAGVLGKIAVKGNRAAALALSRAMDVPRAS
ncbi:SCP2 sterol-binding domain-containing protein [Luteipulveratus mongoliensis]|uniref:SCP2 domain-containing protein n=1 Tax=Luteipulveratus mongoliensis TaxID=571913 RepID=A0A0K1JJR1_9MICO|nr:SCP2 sterol-binding domain-containing protein [Luteipulveratus mongoliensis]AKU16946.1 hypothetical protein VV02_15575 [Luteipulveratus mongoliensis]